MFVNFGVHWCRTIICGYCPSCWIPTTMAKHHPDLVMCRKQPGVALGKLCEKCTCKDRSVVSLRVFRCLSCSLTPSYFPVVLRLNL